MMLRTLCPACADMKGRQCYRVNEYNIKRCATCDTLFVENLPSPSELEAIYTSPGYYQLSPESMQRIADENQRRLKVIKRLQPNGKFLDIGCAHGLLLDMALRNGYETFGIEPSMKNANVASAKGHVVFNGGLAEFVANNPGKQFEVISCLDVIEHVSDPQSFLLLAASLLARDGTMTVSTPNYSGMVAKLLGERDPYLTPPEHLTFLTATGLKLLAFRVGLYAQEYQTFGKLIPTEIDRSIRRYVPKSIVFLSPALHPLIRFLFGVLNLMKMGLEQEVYLARRDNIAQSYSVTQADLYAPMNLKNNSKAELFLQSLNMPRFWHEILACYLLVLGFLSLNPWLRPVSKDDFFSPDKLAHAFAYGGLTIIIFLCFAQSRHGNLRNSARTWIAAISIAVLFGVAIELAQNLFTVNRAGSLEDAVANAIGAGLGYVAYNVVRYLYGKWRQKFERSLKP